MIDRSSATMVHIKLRWFILLLLVTLGVSLMLLFQQQEQRKVHVSYHVYSLGEKISVGPLMPLLVASLPIRHRYHHSVFISCPSADQNVEMPVFLAALSFWHILLPTSSRGPRSTPC